jgi:DNA-binding beta-propeller fold protein YncE
VLAIDKDGKELAIIKDFGFVSAVSAGGGSVWVSDILNKSVYCFKGSFKGTARDLSLTVVDGMEVKGFSAPSFVSADRDDGSAWVMDKGTGMAVLVNNRGDRVASGIGLIPVIGKTVQMVE